MGNISPEGALDLRELKFLPEDHPDIAGCGLTPGDLLFNRTNSIELVGKTAVFGGQLERCAFASYLIRVRLAPLCMPAYLAMCLNSTLGKAWIREVASQQVGQANISGSKLGAFEFPLAPISEQGRIVAEAETQFTRLDVAITALRRAKRKLARYRSSVLEAAIAGELITGTPRSTWKRVILGEVADIQGGIQKQPRRRPASNAFPFLRVANVLRGALDLDEIHNIELFDGELDRLRLKPGDLLIVEGNGSPTEIGRMAIWDGSVENCVHQNHIIRARLDATAVPEYVAAYWNSPTGSSSVMAVSSSTSGLHTLSVRKVSQIPIPLPPMEDQRAICEEIRHRLSIVTAGLSGIERNLKRAARLRQAILKRAFEGRLVPQDPTDEPAEILLQRARANGQSSVGRKAATEGK